MTSFHLRFKQYGHVTFKVYSRRDAMRRGMAKDWDGWGNLINTANAACLRGVDPTGCTIYLHRQALGAGIVTHECAHAVIWMLRERGHTRYATHSNSEETFCYFIEAMVKDFWNEWYRLNPPPKDTTVRLRKKAKGKELSRDARKVL